LLKLDPARATELFRARLNSSSISDRRDAIEHLANVGDVDALPAIAAMLPIEAGAVMPALKQFGSAAEPHLWPHLQHESTTVRRNAISLLSELGTDKSIEPLTAALNDSSLPLARQAGLALRRLSPEAFGVVDEAMLMLRSSSTSDGVEAAALLARAQPDERRPSITPKLEALLIRTRDADRQRVAEAVARWRDAGTVGRLMQHIDEPTDLASHRQGAIIALGLIGDERTLVPISRWLAKEPALAGAAMIRFGQAAEAPALEGLRARSESALLGAIAVLREVGGKRSLAKLYQLAAQHPSAAVKAAAKEAHRVVIERWKATRPQ